MASSHNSQSGITSQNHSLNPSMVFNLPDALQDDAKSAKSSESVDIPLIENISAPSHSFSKSNETIRLGFFQRKDEHTYATITFPSITSIVSVVPETVNTTVTIIQQTASIYGSVDGFIFNNSTQFLPGDYCLAFTFASKSEAKNVTGIFITIKCEPITNFVLSQMIFGMYRVLGFDPSHVMRYPAKTLNAPIPFYRKTRSEIEALSEKLVTPNIDISGIESMIQSHIQPILTELKKYEQLMNLATQISQISTTIGEVSTYVRELSRNNGTSQEQTKNISETLQALTEKINNLQQKLSENVNVETIEKHLSEIQESFRSSEKGGDIQTISVAELDKLIKERDDFYDQLVKAEDYIEEMCS